LRAVCGSYTYDIRFGKDAEAAAVGAKEEAAAAKQAGENAANLAEQAGLDAQAAKDKADAIQIDVSFCDKSPFSYIYICTRRGSVALISNFCCQVRLYARYSSSKPINSCF